MINITVALRDPAPINLKEGNLRGEPRWERQALEALYQSGLFNVNTLMNKWDKVSEVHQGNASSSVLLIQDFQPDIINKYIWKGIIVNLFSEPWLENVPKVLDLYKTYGKKIVFTYGFPKRHGGMQMLQEERVGKENLLLLPVPGAPYIYRENNFDKKVLLMPYRVLLSVLNTPEGHGSIHPTLRWLGNILEEFADYRLCFLTGYSDKEAPLSVIEKALYSTSASNKLLQYKDRISIKHSMSWESVLNTYKGTKLMCQHALSYGGPPIESAMHGIPFVGCKLNEVPMGPLSECPNFLSAIAPEETIPYLDRLIRDREYYTFIGDSYRSYVEQTYTYEKFVAALINILKERGIV